MDVLRCRRCDFFFIGTLQTEAEQLEHAHYADAAAYPGMEASAADAVRSRLALIAKHVPVGRLLDVGAGKGEFVIGATAGSWDAIGVEPSVELAKYAHQHGANIRAGRVNQQEWLPGTAFDAITLLHVLEHVSDPIPLLQSFLPLLSRRGIVFVEVPNCDSNLLRLIDLYYALTGRDWSSRLSPFHPPFHRWGYTKNSLRYALGAAGYTALEVGTLAGGGRGYGLVGRAAPGARTLRRIIARMIELRGNRELLYAICRPAVQSGLRPDSKSR